MVVYFASRALSASPLGSGRIGPSTIVSTTVRSTDTGESA
jgi:hypothetical protein